VPTVLKSWSLKLLEPSGPVQACSGITLLKTSELKLLTCFHTAVVLGKITSVDWITTGSWTTLRNALIFKIVVVFFTRASILRCLTCLYHVVALLLASWWRNVFLFLRDISFLNIFVQVHLCSCYRSKRWPIIVPDITVTAKNQV
jgi:hypothetical protein